MKRKAVAPLSIYLLLTLADGLLTWLGTPDLLLEANPLVMRLGLGWGTLILANLLVFLLVTILGLYTFVWYQPPRVEGARSAAEYVSVLLYDRPDRFHWVFYKLRCHWRPVVASCGFALVWGMICARLWNVLGWLFYFSGDPAWYRLLRRVMPGGRIDVVAGMLVMLLMLVYWFRRQYRRNANARLAVEETA